MFEIDVNLDLDPEKRWVELGEYSEKINELGEQILIDLLPQYNSITATGFKIYRSMYGNKEYLQELKGISKVTGYKYDYLCLLNFYYDLLKVYFDGLSGWGCSAFVCDTNKGPVHARNLDWPSDNGLLSHYSMKQNYYRQGKLLFTAIGWPAYNSVLSGCAPGKFSITLNTVSSNEKAQWAVSVTYLIREVLEYSASFQEAVKKLSETKIMSDCLLTVCGVNSGEFCVIERSPTQFRIRNQSDWIVATNDYKTDLIDINSKLTEMISGDSCSRYYALVMQLGRRKVESLSSALSYVHHESVKNSITMQHMAFCPATGQILAQNAIKAPDLSLKPLI